MCWKFSEYIEIDYTSTYISFNKTWDPTNLKIKYPVIPFDFLYNFSVVGNVMYNLFLSRWYVVLQKNIAYN